MSMRQVVDRVLPAGLASRQVHKLVNITRSGAQLLIRRIMVYVRSFDICKFTLYLTTEPYQINILGSVGKRVLS